MFLPNAADGSGLTIGYQSGKTRLNLSGYGSEVFLLSEAVSGLGYPDIEHQESTHAGVHGAMWRGWNAKPREITLPLVVSSNGDDDESRDGFIGSWDTVTRCFHPGEEGTLSVTTPSGSTRTIGCRCVGIDDSFTVDPVNRGYAVVSVKLMAFDPFWRGAASSVSWSNRGGVDWLGGGPLDKPGTAFPIVLMPGGNQGQALLENVGDLPSWPVWTIRGPVDSFTISLDDARVSYKGGLDEGETMVIDSDPRTQRVDWDGVDAFMLLDSWEFRPIDKATAAKVKVKIKGQGDVTATTQPMFLAAW